MRGCYTASAVLGIFTFIALVLGGVIFGCISSTIIGWLIHHYTSYAWLKATLLSLPIILIIIFFLLRNELRSALESEYDMYDDEF